MAIPVRSACCAFLTWCCFAPSAHAQQSWATAIQNAPDAGPPGINDYLALVQGGKATRIPALSFPVGATGCIPNAAAGNLLATTGISGGCQGITPDSSFQIFGGAFHLSADAATVNLGPAGTDLFGLWPNVSLAVGAASRNVGNLGNCLTGTLPNPGLSPACAPVLGPPGGDLSGGSLSTALVTGVQGFPISNTPPTPNSALVWAGNAYVPTVLSPGINQTFGDILCGPGSGLQPCVISSGAVGNSKLATQAPKTIKANPASGQSPVLDVPVTGGLDFIAGALQIVPTGVAAQQLTVSSDNGVTLSCMTVLATGQIGGLMPGACGNTTTGDTLWADDGATPLWADDGATVLTVDGSPVPGGSPCPALTTDFSVACDAIIMASMLR